MLDVYVCVLMLNLLRRSSFAQYDKEAIKGGDEWGKEFFHNTPFSDDGPYYAGLVTPVIHYCMGGLAISADGRSLFN